MEQYRKLVFCFLILLVVCLLFGCKVEQTDDTKIKDIDYTVCDEKRLPEGLVSVIEDKKKEPFKLTYRTKDYLYIVVGYGACDRKDVRVILTDLYLTKNAIFVDTELCVDENMHKDADVLTYPYIAVKCPLYDVQVEFAR